MVTVDGVAGTFSTLQAAVKAAPNGGTVHVSGVCRGQTVVKSRSGITIEGTPPASCPPGPRDLTATLMGDPTQPLPSGTQQRYAYGPDYALQVLTTAAGYASTANALGFDPKEAPRDPFAELAGEKLR